MNEEKEDTSSHGSLNGHGNSVRRERPPITKPGNAVEFDQLMRQMRAEKDQEGCAQLLSLIDPKDLPIYLSNKLDTETLLLITQSLKHHVVEKKPTLVYQHLSYLCTAHRFMVRLVYISMFEEMSVLPLTNQLLPFVSRCLKVKSDW